MIKFRCPHCNQKLGVPIEYATRRIRCNKCNEPSHVPATEQSKSSTTTIQKPKPPIPESQQRIDTEAFLAPAKQDSVNIQLQTHTSTASSDEVWDIDELQTDDDARRLEAVRQARKLQQQQRQANTKTRKIKDRGSNHAKAERRGGFQLSAITDSVPDLMRIPFALIAAAVAIGTVVIIWITASRATETALGFVALFVPIAAGVGIRLFAVERTFLWGMLGTLIGGLGIAVGKGAIAKHVVIPYYHEQVNKEVLTDLKAVLADEDFQLPSGTSAKFVAEDGDFMQCIALISLVDDNLADPVYARKWILYRLLRTNKTNIYAYLMSQLNAGPDAPPMPEMNTEDEAMLERSWERLVEWGEQDLELRKARQYFAALNFISAQANLQRLIEGPNLFKFALLDTLGLFDALWILLGMGLAYLSLAIE